MVFRPISNNLHNLVGYPFIVNGDFYRELEEAIEDFLTAFLEGYSTAAHWMFANTEEAMGCIDLMVDHPHLIRGRVILFHEDRHTHRD